MGYLIMSDDAPPTGSSNSKKLKGNYPKYAETPMPGYDADADSDEEDTLESSSYFTNAFNVFVLAFFAAQIWVIWTIRADLNIVLAYQKENAQQYAHIVSLLQNQQGQQWQIVPA